MQINDDIILSSKDKSLKDMLDTVDKQIKVGYKGTQVNYSTWADFEADLIKNTYPTGTYSIMLYINGSGKYALLEKASNNYLSYVYFGYGSNITLRKYNNGTWSTSYNGYEEGTGNNGSYIKFDNGTLICWNKIAMTNDVAITSQDGSLYYSSQIQPFPNYPVSFNTPPVVFVTREGGGDNANYWISKTYDCGVNNVRYFQLVTSHSMTASKPDLMYIAIGRWK